MTVDVSWLSLIVLPLGKRCSHCWPLRRVHLEGSASQPAWLLTGTFLVVFTPVCACVLICVYTCRMTSGPRTSCCFQLGAGRRVELTTICSVWVHSVFLTLFFFIWWKITEVEVIFFSWVMTTCLLQAILVAERQIIFLDSLRPDGFGDDLYRTIFRLILKQWKIVLALFNGKLCNLARLSKRSLVLRLKV